MIWYDMIWYDIIWCCLKLFKLVSGLPQALKKKTHILKKWYFLFLRKNGFYVVCVKNTTFELLDPFNEYLHVFLVNFHTGSCQNDTPMFKLWWYLILAYFWICCDMIWYDVVQNFWSWCPACRRRLFFQKIFTLNKNIIFLQNM